MHIIEKHFALVNMSIDFREDAKIRRDEIISVGMLCNPDVTKQYLRHLELEEEMPEEDKKEIAKEKIRTMTAAGKVKSDPVVQKMIRMKRDMAESHQQPIETLTDIMKDDDA